MRRTNNRPDAPVMPARQPMQPARDGRRWLAIGALAAAALLAACGRPADTAVSDASRSAGQVATDVRQEAREAGQVVADKAKDVAITTEVNTLLARDEQLSALKIDVDSHAGQVLLQGSAPNEAARARAADLARSVGGVLGVDNKLTVPTGN